MPRYTKDGGKYGYKKRYRKQKHEQISRVLNNLSRYEFRVLQEIAKHGMGLYTPYREILSKHPKHKVKPSSFEKYASAKNQESLAEDMLREKSEHNNHMSETHYGGGLQDAHNAVADWAYDLALDSSEFVTDWVIDQLDPDTSEDHRRIAKQNVLEGIQYMTADGEIPNDEWIEHILDTPEKQNKQNTFLTVGNAVLDTANWISDILG